MADLRKLAETLGFKDARTLLQSGNMVFRSDRRDGAALEKLLETATLKTFKFPVSYVLRPAAEWKKTIAANPFPKEAARDPSHLLVMFLKGKSDPQRCRLLQAANKGPELIHANGSELYLTYPEGIARSKLTNALIERTLGTCGTARNWNTILTLAAMATE